MNTISAELLQNIKGAALSAQQRTTPFTINPTHLLAIIDQLTIAENKLKDTETFDDMSVQDQFEVVNGWLQTADKSAKEAIADMIVPDGIISLDVRSLGHASDLIAAEKLEEWLNTNGLDSAAQQLGLVSCTLGAATNQLYLYSNAA